MNENDITLLVLCGGQGTRMGGQDKPLLSWHNKPMVDHVLSSVPSSMPKLISANRNLGHYQIRGQVVTDQGINGSGPLAGVLAGLYACQTDWLLVAPGDAPLLPTHWWQTLMQAADGHTAAVLHDQNRQQHLHLLLNRPACTPSLDAFLATGQYQVYRWLQQVEPVQAHVPEQIMNINTAAELQD